MLRSTQANQREEEYKNQIKTLTTRLKEVWKRDRFNSECPCLPNCIHLLSLVYARFTNISKNGILRFAVFHTDTPFCIIDVVFPLLTVVVLIFSNRLP